jgi:hypothetical protein
MREETSLYKDKRTAPRMPADWNVRARLLGADEPFGSLQMDNVSKHGVSLRVGRVLERDSILKLSFTPDDGGAEVHAYATVAWSTAAAQPHAGLRFMGIGEADEERIGALVDRWLNEHQTRH